MAQNTRQGQPANRTTSRPMKGFCRLIKSGARCHHVINQQHRPIGDALSPASVQSGLCWASLWPRQCFGSKDASLNLLA